MAIGDVHLVDFLASKLPGIVTAVVAAIVAVRAYVWREQAKREAVETRLTRIEVLLDNHPGQGEYVSLIEKISALDSRLQRTEYGLTHLSTDQSKMLAAIARIETMLMTRHDHRQHREHD